MFLVLATTRKRKETSGENDSQAITSATRALPTARTRTLIHHQSTDPITPRPILETCPGIDCQPTTARPAPTRTPGPKSVKSPFREDATWCCGHQTRRSASDCTGRMRSRRRTGAKTEWRKGNEANEAGCPSTGITSPRVDGCGFEV